MPNPVTNTPFPMLAIYNQSGLPIAWADFQPQPLSTSDMHLGPDGVGTGLTILIYWRDLLLACQYLLGLSYRTRKAYFDVNGIPVSRLQRLPPWQHPFMNQQYVKAITRVQGGRLQGKNLTSPVDLLPGVTLTGQGSLGGTGPGNMPNLGPYSTWNVAFITLQFWRPPYAIRSDTDILDSNGRPREWLRYVDREWEVNTQFLTREGMSFCASPGQVSPQNIGPVALNELFRGAVGQQVMQCRIMRRWYQIPEACIFMPAQDATRQGRPNNQMYCRTTTTNPVTGYQRTGSSNTLVDLDVIQGGASGLPIGGCVNSPIGGGVRDNDFTKQLFGAPMGTLAFIAAKFITRPLQLPPYLMLIPGFSNNEAISQVQYDIEHHFLLFDPERSPQLFNNGNVTPQGTAIISEAYRGHNLQPWPGDGLWYRWQSQKNIAAGGGFPATAFQYADLSDLYQVL